MTSAPDIPRSVTCAICRCMRSRSTGPSWPACATTPTTASSSSPPRRWDMPCAWSSWPKAWNRNGTRSSWRRPASTTCRVSLLRRDARREVPGMDRGVQCHGDGRQRRHHHNHRAAHPRQVPVRQSSGSEQGRVTSIASKRAASPELALARGVDAAAALIGFPRIPLRRPCSSGRDAASISGSLIVRCPNRQMAFDSAHRHLLVAQHHIRLSF